jgi:hypothetical protein
MLVSLEAFFYKICEDRLSDFQCILVVVANIHVRTVKTEVEEGFRVKRNVTRVSRS